MSRDSAVQQASNSVVHPPGSTICNMWTAVCRNGANEQNCALAVKLWASLLHASSLILINLTIKSGNRFDSKFLKPYLRYSAAALLSSGRIVCDVPKVIKHHFCGSSPPPLAVAIRYKQTALSNSLCHFYCRFTKTLFFICIFNRGPHFSLSSPLHTKIMTPPRKLQTPSWPNKSKVVI